MKHRRLSDASIERLVPAKCVVMANPDTCEWYLAKDEHEEAAGFEVLPYCTIGADEARTLFHEWKEIAIPVVLTYTAEAKNEQD